MPSLPCWRHEGGSQRVEDRTADDEASGRFVARGTKPYSKAIDQDSLAKVIKQRLVRAPLCLEKTFFLFCQLCALKGKHGPQRLVCASYLSISPIRIPARFPLKMQTPASSSKHKENRRHRHCTVRRCSPFSWKNLIHFFMLTDLGGK